MSRSDLNIASELPKSYASPVIPQALFRPTAHLRTIESSAAGLWGCHLSEPANLAPDKIHRRQIDARQLPGVIAIHSQAWEAAQRSGWQCARSCEECSQMRGRQSPQPPSKPEITAVLLSMRNRPVRRLWPLRRPGLPDVIGLFGHGPSQSFTPVTHIENESGTKNPAGFPKILAHLQDRYDRKFNRYKPPPLGSASAIVIAHRWPVGHARAFGSRLQVDPVVITSSINTMPFSRITCAFSANRRAIFSDSFAWDRWVCVGARVRRRGLM